jgi:hypothetical protein
MEGGELDSYPVRASSECSPKGFPKSKLKEFIKKNFSRSSLKQFYALLNSFYAPLNPPQF